jgi:hypothetical protein
MNHFRMVCIPKYLTMILYFEIVETFRAASHNGQPSERPLPNLPIFLVKKRNSWRQNSQKLCRHFGGNSPLGDGFLCEGPKDKSLLSTNQITRISSLLDLRPSCEATLSFLQKNSKK